MLVITDKQLEAFSHRETEKFKGRVITKLEKKFPEKIMILKRTDVLHFMDDMIKFCDNYGITEESEVEKMIMAKVKYDYSIPLEDEFKLELLEGIKKGKSIYKFLEKLRYG